MTECKTTFSHMAFLLRETIAQGWSTWRDPPLSLCADTIYRTYAEDQNPWKLFVKASGWLKMIREVHRCKNVEQIEAARAELVNSMAHTVYGSNMIERAGLGSDITLPLCESIFNGEDVKDMDEHSPGWEDELAELIKVQKDIADLLERHAFLRRREVVQHGRALSTLIHEIAVLENPFTEDLLKNIHGILCDGVPITHSDGTETPSTAYAGRYRSVHVGAGSNMFTPPNRVPQAMTRMIHDLNKDISIINETHQVDPFALASKYCLEFVQIHPFQDGNGRMCRMLLNAILCKYVGVIVPIGEDEAERREYLDIKVRASNEAGDAGELATFVIKKATNRIRRMKQKLTGKNA